MMRPRSRRYLAAALLLSAIAVPSSAAATAPLPVVVGPAYVARVFATGGPRLSHPVALAALGGLVYVGYANGTVADGSDGGASTVAAYTPGGQLSGQYTLRGSISSLRADSTRKVLYAVMNRLGNSALMAITPTTGITGQISLPATPPHGGGFADLAILGGRFFISASNPVLSNTGANTAPALDRLSVAGSQGSPAPLLMGNARALDVATHQPLTLDEVDPTMLAVSPTGDLTMVDQAGSEVVIVHGATSPKPSIASLLTGTQLVELAWTGPGKGRLLVADTSANAVYAIDGTYAAGTAYAISAADSGVSALLGKLNLTTGALKPFAFGFADPAALLYIH